jgi:deoxycytidylate deaminase
MGAVLEEDETPRPEIVIGLVAAVGAPLDEVETALAGALNLVGYRTERVRVSAILGTLSGMPELREIEEASTEYERIKKHMGAGTALRRKLGRGDALGVLAIGEIRRHRAEQDSPQTSIAYVLRSLKNPDEVAALRRVYGSHFSVLGVHTSRRSRLSKLNERLSASEGSMKHDRARSRAEELIAIDEREGGDRFGQNEQDTYAMADYFIDASSVSRIEAELERFVRLLFAHPFETPSRLECGMFHAWGAAMRSAALGRQVGAALTTREGDLIAVGMNEVPKAHGGHYWAGDENDAREFRSGKDQNAKAQQVIARQILNSLANAGWLAVDRTTAAKEDLEGLVHAAMHRAEDGANGPLRPRSRALPNSSARCTRSYLRSSLRRGMASACRTPISSPRRFLATTALSTSSTQESGAFSTSSRIRRASRPSCISMRSRPRTLIPTRRHASRSSRTSASRPLDTRCGSLGRRHSGRTMRESCGRGPQHERFRGSSASIPDT